MQTRDQVVAAVRAAAAERGAATLTKAEFRRASRIADRTIYAHFASWREACLAAGLGPGLNRGKITGDAVMAAMRDAFLACGGIAGRAEFERHFPFSRALLTRRFGTWPETLDAFARWLDRHAPDFPYLDQLAACTAERRKAARDFGDPVGWRGLFHAPTNEMGVVLAFGAAADALGFGIETVGTGFPDCTAKRRIADGRWRSVRIEFEYRSRNFHQHRHDPDGCDLIVCWEHDWPEAPVEVLELKTAIAGLRGG
jgi:hypothetical protein